MATVMGTAVLREQRNDTRVPFVGDLAYQYAPDEGGIGTWRDVSWRGAGVRLGRYLRPGKHVMLTFEAPGEKGQAVELKGQIAWCRPVESHHAFAAGMRIFHDEVDAAEAFSELVEHAMVAESGLV